MASCVCSRVCVSWCVRACVCVIGYDELIYCHPSEWFCLCCLLRIGHRVRVCWCVYRSKVTHAPTTSLRPFLPFLRLGKTLLI